MSDAISVAADFEIQAIAPTDPTITVMYRLNVIASGDHILEISCSTMTDPSNYFYATITLFVTPGILVSLIDDLPGLVYPGIPASTIVTHIPPEVHVGDITYFNVTLYGIK